MTYKLNNDKKIILSNFFSLSILQGLNYILPLITLPYIVRVLGVEYFGLLAFATAIMAYFNLITEFGFNISATKEVAAYRNEPNKLNEIFSTVLTIKILLLIFSFFILSCFIFIFDKLRIDAVIYFLTFGSVIGQVFFPVWFFQGMEKMKFITYLNISSKVFFTICIFIFIKEKEDYWMLPLFTSLGYILAAIIAIYLVKNKFNITYKIPSSESIKFYVKESSYFFISNIAGSLYTVSVTVILGIFTSNTVVGYYAAADKIIQAFKGLVTPFSQAIYPYIVRQVNISKINALHIIKKVAFGTAIVMGGISLLVYVFSELLISLILGEGYNQSIIILKILSPLPFLVSMSSIFGLQTMIPFGRKKQFTTIIVTGGFFSLVISFILIPVYHQIGSAISLILTETLIAMMMFFYLNKNGLKLIGSLKSLEEKS
jgi:polysaccharide transporter, PST family